MILLAGNQALNGLNINQQVCHHNTVSSAGDALEARTSVTRQHQQMAKMFKCNDDARKPFRFQAQSP